MGPTALLAGMMTVLLMSTSVPRKALAAEFYERKTIRFVVGYAAGGGFDVYTRVIARHISKHIPGRPTTIVENMPGAGSLIAANYIYNRAKPDGLTIGNWTGRLVLQQIMERKGIEFDSRKFEWIGAPETNYEACVLSGASGVKNVEEWFAAKKPVRIGGTALGATTVDVPRLLKLVLGLPIDVVQGYKGTADVRLAVETGEVDGGCWTWDTMKRYWGGKIATGEFHVVLQANERKHSDLPSVPLAIDYAKARDDRQLIQVAIHDAAVILRPYSLPPGTPKEVVKVLRKAFMDTMKDPDFLAEASKADLGIDPLSAEKVEEAVSGFFKLKPEQVARLMKILLPQK